jgi:alpha-1,3-rhamnosyl/mannosyltransferase
VTDGASGSGWRPGAAGPGVSASDPSLGGAGSGGITPHRGVRVVIDVRPLQGPERAPATAAYLEGLLGALAADPLPGESFSLLLASDQDDPTLERWPGLPVVGRRLLPPTRFLRSAALTVDPVLLRGASVGAGWHAERDGAGGAVYHAAAGALPLASRIPTVATLLDLAPWQLPGSYQRSAAARLGQRLRARLLRDAATVIVPTRAAAADARRLVRVRAARLRVVGLAPRAAFVPGAASGARHERERLGLGDRYAVYAGRYDARQDLPMLLSALADLAARPAPHDVPWPPRVCLIGASPADRAALSRAAARSGIGELIAYAPRLPDPRLAALVAGARFLVLPVRSETAAFPALDALAAGVPVVASAVGSLVETVGRAGILVEPGDAGRFASAIEAAWSDDELHAGLVAATAERPARTRTWNDVARETRAVWAEVARPAPLL